MVQWVQRNTRANHHHRRCRDSRTRRGVGQDHEPAAMAIPALLVLAAIVAPTSAQRRFAACRDDGCARASLPVAAGGTTHCCYRASAFSWLPPDQENVRGDAAEGFYCSKDYGCDTADLAALVAAPDEPSPGDGASANVAVSAPTSQAKPVAVEAPRAPHPRSAFSRRLTIVAVAAACLVTMLLTVAGLWVSSRCKAKHALQQRLQLRSGEFDDDPESSLSSYDVAVPRGTVWSTWNRLAKTVSSSSPRVAASTREASGSLSSNGSSIAGLADTV